MEAGASRPAALDAYVERCTDLLVDFAGATHVMRTSDAVREVELELLCVDIDGRTFSVPRGGALKLVCWLDAAGSLDRRRVQPVELQVILHVDLAAPVPERRALAHANGPRFTAFLERLEERLGVELFGIRAPGYEDMAGPWGFHEAGSFGRAC